MHRTSGLGDTIRFAATAAKAVRVQITSGTPAGPPMLEELTATG